MKIFVIMGTTGEYSDRTEWAVKALKSEDAAKVFIEEATKIAKEIEVKCDLDEMDRYDLPQNVHPMDSRFSMDYTGTDYYYTDVELEGKE